jgi:hypothetical protein
MLTSLLMRLPLVTAVLCASLAHCNGATLALVGGTVIDVTQFGRSSRDLRDSAILIRDGKIVAVGPRNQVTVPSGARIVDITGKYVLPGLVDGFTGLNSQAQANAHLYMGVTSVALSQDDRRGRWFLRAHPIPHVYLLDGIGSNDEFDMLADRPEWASKLKGHEGESELSWEDSSRMMDQQIKLGVRGLWLGHNLTPANTRRIIAKARRLGFVTYGEFIATPYVDAIAEGVTLLLHMTRYELGLVPRERQLQLAAEPEGKSAKEAYKLVEAISPGDPRVSDYGKLIARSRVALMPTFSLQYADLPGHRNLWKEPIAAILSPQGVFHPTDPQSGESQFPSPEIRARAQTMYGRMWALNQTIAREHPRYLAATGSAVFGSLPGISMHTEMEMLVRVGLTPREALAAATNNYAEQFGWRELGLVAAQRRADLLVLDADPLADIRNTTRVHMVLLEGEAVERAALLKP